MKDEVTGGEDESLDASTTERHEHLSDVKNEVKKKIPT